MLYLSCSLLDSCPLPISFFRFGAPDQSKRFPEPPTAMQNSNLPDLYMTVLLTHLRISCLFFSPQELVYLGPNIFSIYQDHFDFWPTIIRSCLPSHLQTSLVQCHEQNVQMQFHFHHPNNLSKSCSTQASAGSLLKCSHNAIHNCF